MPTESAVGKPDKSGVMSEPTVAIVCVAELLPPVVVPPLVSLVAPVMTDAVVLAAAVGVPETGQMILAPATTVAGAVGVHVPTVTPAGSPEIAHDALSALAVALALLVHLMVPAYAVPTTADAGKPDRSGAMSEPVTAMAVDAVLLAGVASLVALVVPLIGALPTDVGVPETVHVIAAPGATEVGGTGKQLVVNPAGKPLTAHVALVAAMAGAAAFAHVNVPV